MKHCPNNAGYSLIELAAVVSIFSILAAIAIPQAYKYGVELPRIDGAKSHMNSALADCLRHSRSGADLQKTLPDETVISDDLLDNLGYSIKASPSCSSFFITPKSQNAQLAYEFGFRINGAGKATKFAVPAADKASLSSCQAWAGVNCTASAEQQEIWDRIDRIEALKKECNDAFYTFLNSGSKGQKNAWDDESQSCSRVQWVLDGTRYTSKDAYDAAFTAKVGKQCAAELASYSSNNPPNGRYKNDNCGIDTYFLNGVNLESSDPTLYESKKLEYNNQQCNAAENAWLKDGKPGDFIWPSGLSCTAKWKCPAENNKVFLDKSSYDASSCGTPPKPACVEPPPRPICQFIPSHILCARQCP